MWVRPYSTSVTRAQKAGGPLLLLWESGNFKSRNPSALWLKGFGIEPSLGQHVTSRDSP